MLLETAADSHVEKIFHRLIMDSLRRWNFHFRIWNIIYLLVPPQNAVLMIDELENGLGINCIDSVSEMLITEREDIQRIVTSHHPYIINTIPMKRWKIIERDKNTIRAFSAKQLQLGNSKHEAYLQLVNRLQAGRNRYHSASARPY